MTQRKQQHQAAEPGGDDGEPDSFVPDSVVAKELGITVMSLWRRTNDPDGQFPPPIKVSGRNFRSRKQVEEYKARKLREAMRVQHARLNIRRRVPQSMPEELVEPEPSSAKRGRVR
jgi:predicted DNA-binding transcriptional regulator AlpA